MSNTEFETKILNINPTEIAQELRRLGAEETREYLMRRVVFDMKSDGIEWVRVREQNGKTKMTYKYKKLGNSEIGQTTEVEVGVDEFEKTKQILDLLKFSYRQLYQESKVHIFRLNDIEFSIATWPKLEPYLEIEAQSKEKVQEGLKLLGLEGKDAGDLDIAEMYAKKGIEMNAVSELRF